MKLAAIYNVWHDFDMLDHSVENIGPLVDGIIVVASEKSNYGEYSPIPERWRDKVVIREPHFHTAMHSETDKRNFGLNLARRAGYTHFLTIDADEFYEPEPFLKEKEKFKNPALKGLVCLCQVYFKSPTLTVGLDVTLVPFIHELTPTIKHEFNRKYPFAWIDGQIRIDPTRSLNITSGVERTDLIMHHMSWVRADYNLKIRNSSARSNLERSSITEDLILAKEGVICKFYGKRLNTVENRFNIPYYGVENSESVAKAGLERSTD